MRITLPQLPYEKSALEPHISAETLSFHHEKHHQAYVTNLNKLITGTEFEDAPLDTIIQKSHGQPRLTGIFNNAAQIWNHTFYWHSMAPSGGGQPPAPLLARLEKDFGSFETFKAQFKEAALTQFGSGWAWLIEKDDRLSILKTGNAETPLTHQGVTPLLTCDVWEHAYYLDYQNRRPDYVDVFLDHLVNWEFVTKNLSAA